MAVQHDPTKHDAGNADLKPLLTIGYGHRTPDEFTELLKRHHIKYLIDVRSRPYSRFRPEFSKQPLQDMLQSRGFVYHFMGDSLGGMPDDPACLTDGKVDYEKIRQQPWFIHALDRLEKGWQQGHRIALMCAEMEPDRCHRSRLVAQTLVERNVPVSHIDDTGQITSHAAVMNRINRGQLGLF